VLTKQNQQITEGVSTVLQDIAEEYGQSPLLVGTIIPAPQILHGIYALLSLLLLSSGLWVFVLTVLYFWANDGKANYNFHVGNKKPVSGEKITPLVEERVPVEVKAVKISDSSSDEAISILPDTMLAIQVDARPPERITPGNTAKTEIVTFGETRKQLEKMAQRNQQEAGLPPALKAVTVDKPYSTFIVGQSGAGKDITLWNIVKELRERYPDAYFVGIDGKNSEKETNLWESGLYDKVIRISMLDSPKDYHETLIELMRTAIRKVKGMAFIVFSEVNGIRDGYKAHKLNDLWTELAVYIGFCAIQGNSEDKFLLATAQALNLEELGIPKSSRANSSFMAIGNSTQFSFLNQVAGDVNVFDRNNLLDQGAFQSACSRSTATEHLPTHDLLKGIAWFHTACNRWEPMPRLHNPGIDRIAGVKNNGKSEKVLGHKIKVAQPDRWDLFIDSLVRSEQVDFKSFVNWLKKHRGSQVTLEQIKDNWGASQSRITGMGRSRKELMALVHLAVYQKFLNRLNEDLWEVLQ
jgi:hypothetical protein